MSLSKESMIVSKSIIYKHEEIFLSSLWTIMSSLYLQISSKLTLKCYQAQFTPGVKVHKIDFVKIIDGELYFILFSFFFFFLSFLFLFLEQLGLGLISHTVTLVTSWWWSHKTDHKTWENLVEDSRTNDIIQHGHHMLTSWTTHGCLG